MITIISKQMEILTIIKCTLNAKRFVRMYHAINSQSIVQKHPSIGSHGIEW